MKRNAEERTLTRAEMEIMTILWDSGRGMTTHEIIDNYPDPKPAYSTIATFLRVLTMKGFIEHKKSASNGKTFYFSPLIGRQEYARKFMRDIKQSFFAGSLKSLISFFISDEEVTEEELREVATIIGRI